MSKTIKISADFIQEMKSACNEKQLAVLKKSVDAWECTITEDGMRELYDMACNVWKEKFEIKFPEIIKNSNPCSKFNKEQDIYDHLGCDPAKDELKIEVTIYLLILNIYVKSVK